MPWVRFDDQFPIHRKAAGLSDAAFRLHVSAIFWCARNLTDGVVPAGDLEDVSARVRTPTRFAAELVIRGLWHPGDEECNSDQCAASGAPGVDGWVIHDYLEYQPSRSKVLQTREERKRAGAEGGRKSGETRRRSSKGTRSKGEAKTKQVASGLVEPRPRSSLREEGTGGATLRDGAAPPVPAVVTTSGRRICGVHQKEITEGGICSGCIVDAVVPDDAPAGPVPSRDSVRAQLAANHGMYNRKSSQPAAPAAPAAGGHRTDLDRHSSVANQDDDVQPSDEMRSTYMTARSVVDGLDFEGREGLFAAARKHLAELGEDNPGGYRVMVMAAQLHQATQHPTQPPPEEE